MGASVAIRPGGLIDRVATRFGLVERSGLPLSFDQWVEYFTFNGNQYGYGFSPNITHPGEKTEAPDPSFSGYVHMAYQQNAVVFACMGVRLRLFSEARFQFRQLRSGRPGDLFGTAELELLERPWPNATTGDLLARMEQDFSLAGNFYGVRDADSINRLRPDWVGIIVGSKTGGDIDAIDARVLGYVYYPGGPNSGKDPVPLLVEDVVHYAPKPDPLARFRGMSWLTPVVREIMADSAMTTHKINFLENGAVPGLVVSVGPEIQIEAFKKWEALFQEKYGVENRRAYMNAYKTMFLGAGADTTVVGANLEQITFKDVQGAGETRIAAAAGVPPVIVGLSEGLAAATYSNYGQARRAFADGTMRPLWRNAAGSLATVIDVPSGAELWYDDRDIPFLAEDVKDQAEVHVQQATAAKLLVDAGYDADSVIDAIVSGDFRRLKHSGLFSVQLQKPGAQDPAANGQPDDMTAVAERLQELATK